jgi:hypothetical protein
MTGQTGIVGLGTPLTLGYGLSLCGGKDPSGGFDTVYKSYDGVNWTSIIQNPTIGYPLTRIELTTKYETKDGNGTVTEYRCSSVTSSWNGQYILACANAGKVLLSTNYGKTFIDSTISGISQQLWIAVTMSSNGQYMYVISRNPSTH